MIKKGIKQMMTSEKYIDNTWEKKQEKQIQNLSK